MFYPQENEDLEYAALPVRNDSSVFCSGFVTGGLVVVTVVLTTLHFLFK